LHLATPAQIGALLGVIKERPLARIIGSAVTEVPSVSQALNCFQVNVPDFRARREDLGVAFESLLRQAVRTRNVEMPEIPMFLLSEIKSRQWLGNLAEMRDFANTFLDAQIAKHQIENQTLADQLDGFERTVLENTLRRCQGKAVKAANLLGLPRKTFYDRLARYSLRPRDYQ
jgi:two-component system C4-dicarboxylate transport response regulator DctD